MLGALALAVGTAFALYLLRHRPGRAEQAPRRHPEPLPAPRRPAIETTREVHLHFHGVTAEDVAAIVAHVNREDR